MKTRYRFGTESRISVENNQNLVRFAADSLRPPLAFSGVLGQANEALREMLLAYHSVVTLNHQPYRNKSSDELRYQLVRHDTSLLAECLAQREAEASAGLAAGIERVYRELSSLQQQGSSLLRPYYKARRQYVDYVLQHRRESWLAGLPFASVNADGLILEGLSRDESVYTRLCFGTDAFESIGALEYGSGCIDYTADLYAALMKLRAYRHSVIELGNGTGAAANDTEDYRERSLEVPDGWIRTLLQMNTAMTRELTVFRLQAMDLHNLCLLLRQSKDRAGRLKIVLEPGRPVKIEVAGRRGRTLECPRTIYEGAQASHCELWDSRRLLLLEPLIPVVDEFEVRCHGDGMPVFFNAAADALSLCVGLSGWKAGDWSRQGIFNLMHPDPQVTEYMKIRALKVLHRSSRESAASLATQLDITPALARAILDACVQAGEACYAPERGLYYSRSMQLEAEQLKSFLYASPAEATASRLLEQGQVAIDDVRARDGYVHLLGSVQEKVIRYQPDLILDDAQRLVNGSCYCRFYKRNKLKQGPCEHILALRMFYNDNKGLVSEKTTG